MEDFFVGCLVEAFGLTKEELNGQRGKVVGVKALRPGNLKLLE